MLSPSLPFVPFAIPPRKEWKPGQEKKPRLDIKKFEKKFKKSYIKKKIEDEGSDASFSSYSSSGSESELSSDEESSPKQKVAKSGKRFASTRNKFNDPNDEYIPPVDTSVKKESPEPKINPSTVAGTDSEDFMSNVAYLLSNPQLLLKDKQYLIDQGSTRQPRRHLISAEFKHKYLRNPVTRFFEWKAAEKERRMHYMYREYERRIKEYDEKLKEDARKEIEEAEKEVLIEAYKSGERVKKSLIKKRNKLAVNKKMVETMERRDQEEIRMAWNCENLPKWAVENAVGKDHSDEQSRLDAIQAAEAERLRRINQRIAEMDAHDEALYQEDISITRQVTDIMRRSGVITGVNAGTHKLPPIKTSPDKLLISLKQNVSFANFGNKRTAHEYFYPFDHEIAPSANELRTLKARAIGERGALCLSGDFVRTPLPQLEILDLSFCEMKTRGLGRVLRGIKVAKLYGLVELNLKGNHITTRALDFIRDLFDTDVFLNLRVLDLSDNDLGDECAVPLIRMIFADSLKNLAELHLENNGIKDLGFSQLIKVLQSAYVKNCPNLERVALGRNLISAQTKRDLAPLPHFVSV